MARDVAVTVYLLHFDRPFGHARHYAGWAGRLEERLAHHANGTGANLLRHVRAAGITWRLVRIWPNATRELERRLHGYGHGRKCPVCNPIRRRSRSSVAVVE